MKTCLPRPLELEILHHYYVCGYDFERIEAPACREAVSWLCRYDLLEVTPPEANIGYKITERGIAHLKSLLCVPLPEKRWETPWEKV